MAQYRDRVGPDPLLHARVRVAPRGASFELMRDGAVLAEREFESMPRRCGERVQAVAIALVLAFESVQARQRDATPEIAAPAGAGNDASALATPASGITPAEPEPPIGAKPAASEPPAEEPVAEEIDRDAQLEPVAEREPESERAAPSGWLELHTGAGVLLGGLPEPALLFTLGAGIVLSSALQLELTALASPGVTHALADGLVDAQLFGGQGALCLSTPLGALRAAGCAGIAAAAVPARGRDFAVRDRSVLTGWAAVLLAGALELRVVGPLSARVFAGLYGSLVRPALEAKVDGARPDATPFPIGGVLLLQVLWALP